MKLTPHFWLDEFTRSQTAARKGIDNTPNDEEMTNLEHTAKHMEQIRSILGHRRIHISSGFRSEDLNRAIGGSTTSYHRYGLAVDFNCRSFGSTSEIVARLRKSSLVFDQLIDEFGRWVHVGFPKPGDTPRRQVLRAFRERGKTKYEHIGENDA